MYSDQGGHICRVLLFTVGGKKIRGVFMHRGSTRKRTRRRKKRRKRRRKRRRTRRSKSRQSNMRKENDLQCIVKCKQTDQPKK